MKLIATSALVSFSVLAIVEPSGASGSPAQATLLEAVKIPVTNGGKANGWITVPGGIAVTVEEVQPSQLLINFAGSDEWIQRSATDFDRRSAPEASPSLARAAILNQLQQTLQERAATARAQQEKAAADLQGQLANYVSPLESGPYNQNRSVVDYYDCWGNRYNIGIFDQRIYN